MLTTLAVFILGVLAPPATVPVRGQVQASASVGWTEFAPPNGRFTVRLPGKPRETVSTNRTAVGEAKMVQYDFDGGDAYFAVVISEFPSGALGKTLPQQVLDGARDGALANVRGRAVEEFGVFLRAAAGGKGAFPGRQIVAEVPPDLVLRVRVFLVNDTLISLMLVQKKAVASPETFLKMADSFKLAR